MGKWPPGKLKKHKLPTDKRLKSWVFLGSQGCRLLVQRGPPPRKFTL